MKITSDYNNLYSGRLNRSEVKGTSNFAQELSKASSAASVDSVQISTRRTTSDDEFVKSLSSKISSEVKNGTPAEELSDIKRQIALGEYDINANEIAKKIML